MCLFCVGQVACWSSKASRLAADTEKMDRNGNKSSECIAVGIAVDCCTLAVSWEQYSRSQYSETLY